MMTPAIRQALGVYGRAIQKHGWRAGEPIIERFEKKYPDFRQFAYALGIVLRAKELLES